MNAHVLAFSSIGGTMTKKIVSFLFIFCLLLTESISAEASGRYKWWAIASDGDWFNNGIVCWEKGGDIKVGNRAVFYTKLGQGNTYKKLGSAYGIAGDHLVDSSNGTPVDLNQQDQDGNYVDNDGNTISTMEACSDGAKSIAFISPRTPSNPGAYVLRIKMYNSRGKYLWYDDSKILQDGIGANSGSSYFSNPPAIYFSSGTYAYMGSNYGLIPYTTSGKKRNACLVIRDFIYSTVSASLSKSDIIYSAQRGNLRRNLSNEINATAPPIAIKCAAWMATYLK